MMVRLILILLLLNMFYFGWSYTQKPASSKASAETIAYEQSEHVGSLQLISERVEVPVEAVSQDTTISQETIVSHEAIANEIPALEEISSEPELSPVLIPQCFQLTQALEPDNAESLAQELVNMGLSVSITTEKKVLEPHYWLIYPPFENFSAARALYTQLMDKGFDSFVIPSGEQRNGVSLGLFNNQQTATERAKEFSALNLTEIEPIILRHARIEQKQFAHILLKSESDAEVVSERLTSKELEHRGPQECPENSKSFPEAD